jgi:hypothetical protein
MILILALALVLAIMTVSILYAGRPSITLDVITGLLTVLYTFVLLFVSVVLLRG